MIDQTTAASSVQTSFRSTPLPDNGAKALSSDFDTFIRMLTVQVQNQDPMNPVDSTDYATQLATFSSVEQQVLTNDLLKELGYALGGTALQQAGGWIGMEGLVRAPAVFDQSNPVTIHPAINSGADSAYLIVRETAGQIVDRVPIELDGSPVQWDGRDASGGLLPAGEYSFEVETYIGEDLVEVATAPVYSRIDEVRSQAGIVMVRVADGTELPASLVDGLRASR